MSKIISCYKWVLDERDIRVNPDLSVDTSRAKAKISEYDRNAIEMALRSAADDDEVIALTYGTGDIKKSLKDVLSRGPAQVYYVDDASALAADGRVTAKVLAAAIQKVGDTKLVLCSEGAADTYAHEIGPRLGALLGLPVVSYVCEMSVEGQTLTATRKLGDVLETVRVQLPAVVTLLPEICEAPIPGLRAVMAAGRKPKTKLTLDDLGLAPDELAPRLRLERTVGYAGARKNILFTEGEPAERVAALVDALVAEGVLS